MTRIIFLFVICAAAACSTATVETLTEELDGASVTSRQVGRHIDTTVEIDGAMRATLSWDESADTARFVVGDTTIDVKLDVPFDLEAANRSAISLWNSYEQAGEVTPVVEDGASLLGCGCHWDGGGCGGGGAVSCCCGWSDICNSAC